MVEIKYTDTDTGYTKSFLVVVDDVQEAASVPSPLDWMVRRQALKEAIDLVINDGTNLVNNHWMHGAGNMDVRKLERALDKLKKAF